MELEEERTNGSLSECSPCVWLAMGSNDHKENFKGGDQPEKNEQGEKTKTRMNMKRVTEERVHKARITQDRMTKERMIIKRIINDQISKKRITMERMSN